VLSEKVIPSLELAVADNPAYRTESGAAEQAWPAPDWKLMLAAAASLAVVVYLVRRVWPFLDSARLQAVMAGLRALLTRLWRKWIKAPVGLPTLNPSPVKERK